MRQIKCSWRVPQAHPIRPHYRLEAQGDPAVACLATKGNANLYGLAYPRAAHHDSPLPADNGRPAHGEADIGPRR